MPNKLKKFLMTAYCVLFLVTLVVALFYMGLLLYVTAYIAGMIMMFTFIHCISTLLLGD